MKVGRYTRYLPRTAAAAAVYVAPRWHPHWPFAFRVVASALAWVADPVRRRGDRAGDHPVHRPHLVHAVVHPLRAGNDLPGDAQLRREVRPERARRRRRCNNAGARVWLRGCGLLAGLLPDLDCAACRDMSGPCATASP